MGSALPVWITPLPERYSIKRGGARFCHAVYEVEIRGQLHLLSIKPLALCQRDTKLKGVGPGFAVQCMRWR